jgi:phage gp46-like protein
MTEQQGDVLLFQTNDGGDVSVSGGLVKMSGGLETAAYLSLFGGNEDDNGQAGNPETWWGNVNEPEPRRQYRSETQYLLRSLAAVPANLRRLEQAAVRDLSWMVAAGVATEVLAAASMPGLNQVRIVATINAGGSPSTIEFFENWKADAR